MPEFEIGDVVSMTYPIRNFTVNAYEKKENGYVYLLIYFNNNIITFINDISERALFLVQRGQEIRDRENAQRENRAIANNMLVNNNVHVNQPLGTIPNYGNGTVPLHNLNGFVAGSTITPGVNSYNNTIHTNGVFTTGTDISSIGTSDYETMELPLIRRAFASTVASDSINSTREAIDTDIINSIVNSANGVESMTISESVGIFTVYDDVQDSLSRSADFYQGIK